MGCIAERPEAGARRRAEVVQPALAAKGFKAGVDFYLAFSMFRLASILQGVYARGLQGNAASSYALERGAAAQLIAERGWEISQRS